MFIYKGCCCGLRGQDKKHMSKLAFTLKVFWILHCSSFQLLLPLSFLFFPSHLWVQRRPSGTWLCSLVYSRRRTEGRAGSCVGNQRAWIWSADTHKYTHTHTHKYRNMFMCQHRETECAFSSVFDYFTQGFGIELKQKQHKLQYCVSDQTTTRGCCSCGLDLKLYVALKIMCCCGTARGFSVANLLTLTAQWKPNQKAFFHSTKNTKKSNNC